MKLYMILSYNKAGYPIGPFFIVASNAIKAKAALKKEEIGWIGKMEVLSIKNVIVTN